MKGHQDYVPNYRLLSVNKVLMLAKLERLYLSSSDRSGRSSKTATKYYQAWQKATKSTNLRIDWGYVQRIHTGPCVAFQYRTLFIDYPG